MTGFPPASGSSPVASASASPAGKASDAAFPSIAVTVGDVAGVGPEIALQAIVDPAVRSVCRPRLIGPAGAIRHVAGRLGLPIAGAESWIDCGNVDTADLRAGRFSAATGRASFAAVDRAIEMAMAGEVAAMVTGPIQKEAWDAAELGFPGHTEMLAARTGTSTVRMMLTSDQISCVLVTIHVPLAEVPGRITRDGIVDSIRLADAAMTRRLGRRPRVCCCGLNPHAGENGLFSHGEEQDRIAPAVEITRRAGVDVTGPVPPDTAFTPAMRRRFDVHVCMYHDQGLIPLKALAFETAVNVTLGLPIVRTSVDHGTAMDIAWQGVADTRSMIAAIRLAAELS